MVSITATRTSHAPSTQKTSGEFSTTAGTSFKGCTYDSTSFCDLLHALVATRFSPSVVHLGVEPRDPVVNCAIRAFLLSSDAFGSTEVLPSMQWSSDSKCTRENKILKRNKKQKQKQKQMKTNYTKSGTIHSFIHAYED